MRKKIVQQKLKEIKKELKRTSNRIHKFQNYEPKKQLTTYSCQLRDLLIIELVHKRRLLIQIKKLMVERLFLEGSKSDYRSFAYLTSKGKSLGISKK